MCKARRVMYSAMLTAAPRLMEPIYRVEIQCPAICTAAVSQVISRRRGHVVDERPIGGTPLVSVIAHVMFFLFYFPLFFACAEMTRTFVYSQT